MVDIAFDPPLRSETEVRPAIAGDHSIKLTFHATLNGVAEWRRLKQQGATVELWSNLPIQGGEPGSWNAIAFEEIETGVERNQFKEGNVQLCAVLYLQYLLQASNASRFSFTYRIKFAGGRVQWLGSHTSNGSVSLKPEAYWTPSNDPDNSSLGCISKGVKWRAWGIAHNEPPKLLALGDNQSAPVQTLLLISDGPRKLNQGPPLFFNSSYNSLTIADGQIQCSTPRDVLIQCGSILQAIRQSGLQVVPTTTEDCFLISSYSSGSNVASFPLSPIWLSSHTPAKITIKASHIQDLLASSEDFVLYLPGDEISQSILPSNGEYEIPLAAGFKSLCVVRMQTFTGMPGQVIGVATPASIVGQSTSPAPSLSSPSSTNTSVTSTDSQPKGAILTVSRPSGVLINRIVPLPLIVVRQIDRLMRIRLLSAFYRLAMYILSLVLPFFGVALSLKWAISHGSGKQELLQTEQKETVKTDKITETDEMLVSFDVEPMGGQINVAFRGDSVDDIAFIFEGKNVDQVIATWQGDDLHQFSLQVDDHRGILTAIVGPPTTE